MTDLSTLERLEQYLARYQDCTDCDHSIIAGELPALLAELRLLRELRDAVLDTTVHTHLNTMIALDGTKPKIARLVAAIAACRAAARGAEHVALDAYRAARARTETP